MMLVVGSVSMVCDADPGSRNKNTATIRDNILYRRLANDNRIHSRAAPTPLRARAPHPHVALLKVVVLLSFADDDDDDDGV